MYDRKVYTGFSSSNEIEGFTKTAAISSPGSKIFVIIPSKNSLFVKVSDSTSAAITTINAMVEPKHKAFCFRKNIQRARTRINEMNKPAYTNFISIISSPISDSPSNK
jgi:hypothetical protein